MSWSKYAVFLVLIMFRLYFILKLKKLINQLIDMSFTNPML
jgi:hypothetical protein